MKIIIAGSRNINNYELIKETMDNILKTLNIPITIISGGANGVDKLGERYALEKHLGLTVYPADWDTYGKSAGYIRNEQMANVGNMLVAFWDGKSKGTKHMIDLAEKYNLIIKIIKED